MALSREDKKDVGKKMGKAIANRVSDATHDYKADNARAEKIRSKRHFKQRVLDKGGDPAKTKALRRFVDKTFKEKSWHHSGEEIRRRTAITGPAIKEAARRGVNTHYIY